MTTNSRGKHVRVLAAATYPITHYVQESCAAMILGIEKVIPEPYFSAHKDAGFHRPALEKANVAGCFHCCQQFGIEEITEMVDRGQTALCPRCSIDAVLPGPAYRESQLFLEEMHNYWFQVPEEIMLPPPPGPFKRAWKRVRRLLLRPWARVRRLIRRRVERLLRKL